MLTGEKENDMHVMFAFCIWMQKFLNAGNIFLCIIKILYDWWRMSGLECNKCIRVHYVCYINFSLYNEWVSTKPNETASLKPQNKATSPSAAASGCFGLVSSSTGGSVARLYQRGWYLHLKAPESRCYLHLTTLHEPSNQLVQQPDFHHFHACGSVTPGQMAAKPSPEVRERSPDELQ